MNVFGLKKGQNRSRHNREYELGLWSDVGLGGGFDRHFLKNGRVGGEWVVAIVAGQTDNFVHYVQPFDDFAIGGVLTVQVGRSRDHQKELASGRVDVVGSGGTQDSANVLDVIKLGSNPVWWTTHAMGRAVVASGVGIAALDHEARNDPVELGPVIKPFPSQGFEILDMIGGLVFEETKHDTAKIGLEHGDFFTGDCLRHIPLFPNLEGINLSLGPGVVV
jgi:hypothetical protein